MNTTKQTQPDHVFAQGFGTNLGHFANDFDAEWPELAAAFRTAQPATQTAPFQMTASRTTPRPDAHSLLFGKALVEMRREIRAFLQTADDQGNSNARITHKAALMRVWQNLLDAVEDAEVARLIPQNQQNQLIKGRQALLQVKFDIMHVINIG